jgi:hypothetical protein
MLEWHFRRKDFSNHSQGKEKSEEPSQEANDEQEPATELCYFKARPQHRRPREVQSLPQGYHRMKVGDLGPSIDYEEDT